MMKVLGARRLHLPPWQRLFTRRLLKTRSTPLLDRTWDRVVERGYLERKAREALRQTQP